MVFPTSPCPKVIDDPVAHYSRYTLSFLIHLRLLTSFDAVNVSPCVAVPLIVTLPVGSSLTFATAEVADDATLSEVP